MQPDTLYDAYQDDLEDAWGRRENGPRFVRETHLFGWPLRLSSNDEHALAAAGHSLPLYSSAPPLEQTPLHVHFVVRDGARAAIADPGRPPDNLFDHIRYSGYGHWLAIHAGAWGMVFIDLESGRATAILTPQLAARPELVSRCLLNTIFNNLLESRGYSMLHTTGLLRGARALLLMAPHNSGKSTTALRLALAGYTFLSDSQVYVAPRTDRLQLLGFPIGKAKLRADVVAEFPQMRPYLEAEQVRDEVKYRVNLRRFNPALVREEAIVPAGIDLCLLHRNGKRDSHVTPAGRAAVEAAIMHNSIYWNQRQAWRRNLRPIARLLQQTRCHHLAIGTDPAGIVATVNQLIGD